MYTDDETINDLLRDLESSGHHLALMAADAIRHFRIEADLLKQQIEGTTMMGTAVLYRPIAPYVRQALRRGEDEWGSGAYGSTRGDRTHNGVDYLIPAGCDIHSTITGNVSKIGLPYRNSYYRYIEVTDMQGNHVRHFYVSPTVTAGDPVNKGDKIGTLQDLGERYPADEDHKEPIPTHMHLEVMTSDRKSFIDPDNYHFA